MKLVRHKISNRDYNLLRQLAKRRGFSMREMFDAVFFAYLLPLKARPEDRRSSVGRTSACSRCHR
jgi:hypothetical protein